MNYSEEAKSQALELADKYGVTKASKELHIAEQTLYRWRKIARITNDEQKTQDDNEDYQYTDSTKPTISGCFDPHKEIEEMKKLNESCQKTIEYLVEENTSLRDQCEKYLLAISLITQR